MQNLHIVEATTIHHWAGLLDGRYNTHELLKCLSDTEHSHDTLSRMRTTDVLIINGISMLSAKLLEQIHVECCFARGREELFDGIQVICCDDFHQLPPVPNDN